MKNFIRQARFALLFALIFVSLLMSHPSHAAQEIKVGAYDFAPYFSAEDKQNESLIVTAVGVLNEIQSEFRFKIVPIPAKRRYEMLKKRQVDVLFFEDKAWGWKTEAIDFLPLPLKDGEVYIAKKDEHVDDKVFEKFNGKKVMGVLGFHYACTQFIDNPEIQIKDFEFSTAMDREHIIHQVLKGKADVGILTRSYLQRILNLRKDWADKIFVGKKPDQTYNLGIIANKNSFLESIQFKNLINQFLKNKKFIAAAKPLDLL